MSRSWGHALILGVVIALLPQVVTADVGTTEGVDGQRLVARHGTVTFEFDRGTLDAVDLRFAARGNLDDDAGRIGDSFTVAIQSTSTLAVNVEAEMVRSFVGGAADTCGALLFDIPGERVVIGNMSIEGTGPDALLIKSAVGDSEEEVVFQLTSVTIEYVPSTQELLVAGDFSVTQEWALAKDLPDLADVILGRVYIEAQTAATTTIKPPTRSCRSADQTGSVSGEPHVPTPGTDVIVGDLSGTMRYDRVGDITGFSIATTSCNMGDERANWYANDSRHPVILQDVYKLKDDKFEQIGMSWVKHGFYATSESLCTPCVDPVTLGQQLGVGCSDLYTAWLNGVQTNMSARSEINGHTGVFTYGGGTPPANDLLERRIQIRDAELALVPNAGARYFMQGFYVNRDDALDGNMDNNASYREISITEPLPDQYQLSIRSGWPTQREQAAVRAWQDVDPTVTETDIKVPGEGLFILAAKATEVSAGIWRYSYALQNLTSDRSGQSFRVPIPAGADITNVDFHDIDYHSGEPYDGTPWSYTVSGSAVTWFTDTYDVNPNANALRYDTTYNFYFDINVMPATSKVRLNLFKPGAPDFVAASSIGPELDLIDCNNNTYADACDVDCSAIGCEQPCGGSLDCNDNDMPDECEPDCNGNGIADGCDLTDCTPGDLSCDDCNSNLVPDGCEVDCDFNGIPDDCVIPADDDGDGLNNCVDLCPTTTPVNACVCPELGTCCWGPSTCYTPYPLASCEAAGGVPSCSERPCREGCLIGDADMDGDLDLWDVWKFQECYSGPVEDPGYVIPLAGCLFLFDFDDDEDIDLADHGVFYWELSGP